MFDQCHVGAGWSARKKIAVKARTTHHPIIYEQTVMQVLSAFHEEGLVEYARTIRSDMCPPSPSPGGVSTVHQVEGWKAPSSSCSWASVRQHSVQTHASSTWDWGSPGKRLSFLSFPPSSRSHLRSIGMAETHVLTGARNAVLSNSTINAAGTMVCNINTRRICQ